MINMIWNIHNVLQSTAPENVMINIDNNKSDEDDK